MKKIIKLSLIVFFIISIAIVYAASDSPDEICWEMFAGTFCIKGTNITHSITIEGNVTADYFMGNGSLLTGVTTESSGNVSIMYGENSTGDVNPVMTTDDNILKLSLISSVWETVSDVAQLVSQKNISMGSFYIKNVADPVEAQDAATMNFVNTTRDDTHTAFEVYLSGDQTLASGAFDQINWTDETFDTGNDFDIANHQYVVPADGVYHFTATLRFNGLNDGERAIIEIAKDGATFRRGEFINNGADYVVDIMVSATVQLDTGDLIGITGYHRSGNDEVVDCDIRYTRFSGFRVS